MDELKGQQNFDNPTKEDGQKWKKLLEENAKYHKTLHFVVLIDCPITSFGLMSYLSFFESISFLHCHCQNVMSFDISHSPLKVFSISVHPLLSDY